MQTDSALTTLRRPLKPLLAEILDGEPWRDMVVAGHVDQPVLAACVASFVTRRDAEWVRWSAEDLPHNVAALVAAEEAAPEFQEWPFLDALSRALPLADWPVIDRLLSPYRKAWPARLER